MSFFSKNQNQNQNEELKYLMEACTEGFEKAMDNIARFPQYRTLSKELEREYLGSLENIQNQSQASHKPGP